jgi:epoxide hydrolase-like predicted phosphatase
MTIRAVIFDLGGVLVRTVDPKPRGEYARRLGLTYADLDHLVFNHTTAVQATVGALTAEEHWEGVRQALALPVEELPVLQAAFWGGDVLDQDLVQYLRSLRPCCKTALLSNAWSHLRGWLENLWQIVDAFDEIIISSEIGVAKPDERAFRFALERLGVAPQEAVFVDDFNENVAAARRVGMQGVLFQSTGQVMAELDRLLGRDERRRSPDE